MMRLSVAQRSERGGRLRNEDSLGFCANDTRGCFVLADGAGGHGGGAVAAKVVVKQVLTLFSTTPEVSPENIAASIPAARRALAHVRERYPRLAAMDTTIATLMLDTQKALAYWSYLGDSRIYFFRNGRARTLTNDHSVLQSMIDAGLGSGATRGNKERNTLYAAVGSGEVPAQAICDKPLALQSGDIFLLCSDGFWEKVNEEAMEALLQRATSPEHWLNEMVSQLPDPDSDDQDNFSALAVWIGEQEEITRVIAKDEQPNEQTRQLN
jgi:serine/threonine protein phosphatase PrpC